MFTNGCFDILHVGHIKYLEATKNLGDILIVGLNSDKSVRRIKGNNRPINNQNDRAYILASLEDDEDIDDDSVDGNDGDGVNGDQVKMMVVGAIAEKWKHQ